MKIVHLLSSARRQAGFTMIELLIVIAILGILAVAVLSAINPIEQINRGRDTGTRSDAEQLLSAIERFNANKGYYPWDEATDAATEIDPMKLVTNETSSAWVVGSCNVLDILGAGGTGCSGSNEVKQAFVNRISNLGSEKGLYAYKKDGTGSTSLYVCFTPQSDEFNLQARSRCTNEVPDLDDYPPSACAATASAVSMVCLP